MYSISTHTYILMYKTKLYMFFPRNIWILMSEKLQNPHFLQREFFHKGRIFPDFWLPKQALHVLYAVMLSTSFGSNMTMKYTILQVVAWFCTLLLRTPESEFPWSSEKSILKGNSQTHLFQAEHSEHWLQSTD